MPEFNTISLSLKNEGLAALCIPQVDTDEDITFWQGGNRVFPLVEHNRAAMFWRGADLISGFIVVPPAHHVEFYYTLSDWELHPGPATAEITFPVYDCAQFFQTSTPQADTFTSRKPFVVARFRSLGK